MDQKIIFSGMNLGYVLELYDRYRADPESVDTQTRDFFAHWRPPAPQAEAVPASVPPGIDPEVVAQVVRLSRALRAYGHLAARLDPLGGDPPGDPTLESSYYQLDEATLRQLPAALAGGPISEDSQNAAEAIERLRKVYATSTGYDYSHIHNPEERDWLHFSAECGQFRPPDDPVDALVLLDRLTKVEAFEHFLHRIFPGKTRFSIEGVDMLVPMLDEVIRCAADENVCTLAIGMAHRGRLNVLAHILGKPFPEILTEFKDPIQHYSMREELGWTGDVKYHKGAHHAMQGGDEVQMVLMMAPNPSHLEHINPVVIGMARAADSKTDQPGTPEVFFNACLPIQIHGDAAFSAQGVVAETLNMSRLKGYRVGGTIHIITNNQLGYTTLPEAGRSTLYASDLAKGFEIPIMHVNADDPLACIEAARTAIAYRQKFHKDFLIDLIGYRRYGHNEGDEPGFTQPLLYHKIDQHPTVRQLWADRLAEQGEIEIDSAGEKFQQVIDDLQAVLAGLKLEDGLEEEPLEVPPRGAARRVETGVPLEALQSLNQHLLEVPPDFHLNRKLVRGMDRRRTAFDDIDKPSIDWAAAEELALASILMDGTPIRLTGEDVQRGTFSHRHAVFHDVENGERYTPLQNLPQARAAFEVVNSPLSENAALGFEYGYNIQARNSLVIWEAQYGDFINAGQAMIDEFIVSARAKWELTPSLVLLLPHGHEGQGPDHSSGRPERFLQLAADINLRLANCTTAAQYFHLLRRQAALLETDPLPLIVLAPKSLLRHPMVASPVRDLIEGKFQPVIDDADARRRADQIRRVILCSGKIYVDLVSSPAREENPQVAIVRLEQIYRFPADDIRQILEGYPQLEDVLWVQEEPSNMGAWSFVRPPLLDLIGGRWPLGFVGRSDSSSPAEGSTALHNRRQKIIIQTAFTEAVTQVKEVA